MRYILEATETPAEGLRDVARELGPRVEEAYMTGAEVLEARGEARGRAEGKAEGKAEAVLRVLAARGFAVAEAQRQRISTCTDLGQLDRWLERAVTASSTADVLGVAD